MPAALTYPGVYVEEIPSGVRTIVGVATSLAAFIGRAARGPVNEPVTVNGYGDFERIFGGLWAESTLGYAVRDYFLNGGSQAVIVRLFHPDTGNQVPPTNTPLKVGGLTLEAAHPGSWGTRLRASVDDDVSADVARAMGLAKEDIFNLFVSEAGPGGATEQFRNLTVKPGPRRIDKVLIAESQLLRWAGDWPANVPQVIPGDDPLTTAERQRDTARQQLKAAQAAHSPNQADIDTAQTALTNALQEVTDAQDAMATSDGLALTEDNFTPNGSTDAKKGLYALEHVDIFNMLCIPPHAHGGTIEAKLVGDAAAYCERRRAILLVDPPAEWHTKQGAKDGLGTVGTTSKNAALFFPRLRQPDPLHGNQLGEFVPCGAVAGVFARTDATRGVWKAPAGLDATLVGVPALSVPLTDLENGELNPLGINCLRSLPAAGTVVWGARTRQGDDRLASEWKYIPVRRTALFIEESLYRGTQWVVFEPNDEPLWAQIRLNIGAFMQNLFRQGAFQGKTAREAYLVRCDRETTTQTDINSGIVNIIVGFAPLKPAEFVVIRLQQMAGQIAV